jgi:hypothetical protein
MSTLSKAIGQTALLWLHVGVGPLIGTGPLDPCRPSQRPAGAIADNRRSRRAIRQTRVVQVTQLVVDIVNCSQCYNLDGVGKGSDGRR